MQYYANYVQNREQLSDELGSMRASFSTSTTVSRSTTASREEAKHYHHYYTGSWAQTTRSIGDIKKSIPLQTYYFIEWKRFLVGRQALINHQEGTQAGDP
jgi:hypothetical protein